MHLPKIGPLAPLVLAAVALGLLALGPLGTRLGWWAYGFGLYRLMPASALLAAIAVVLSILALAREWPPLHLRGPAPPPLARAPAPTPRARPAFRWDARKTPPPIPRSTTATHNPPALR